MSLTGREIERLDFVHNGIFELVKSLDPRPEFDAKPKLEWDMEIIGEVSEVIEEYFVRKGICTEREFAPYDIMEEDKT